MNRTIRLIAVAATLCLVVSSNVHAANVRDAIKKGLKELKADKGSTELCAITDATYVRVNGKTSEAYVDVIQEETGCSVGKGNLLFFHRATCHPLKIALFRKENKQCFVIDCDGDKVQTQQYDLGLEVTSKPGFWKEVGGPLAPDAFTVGTIAHAWASGAPQDLLKCAEFHNHLCAGVSSGYMIAKVIRDRYPLKKGERYTWIASPAFCKEDAVQMLLDVTAGKKSLIVEKLTESQEKNIAFENPAGILVVWNQKKGKGKGVVFDFNWDKARRKDMDKLKTMLGMLPYLERPDAFVGVVKEFDVTPQMLQRLTTAETNPYKWLDLTKQ
ncbi:MAG: FmdE family protein [Thermodesulfobacteriota bacterium]|nr:FmdE family protein [Thermodesulfobacteriota bacterium]